MMKTKPVIRKAPTARSHTALRRRLLPVLIAGCFGPGAVIANPGGHQVVSGQAGFNQQGSTLTVTNSPGAIINWKNFSINAGETTRFVQQSASSSVLNRVVGQDPSQILGTLQSNGRVFLVNPNGVLFGKGATVDVNGLVASTLNISNDDFLAGRMKFAGGGAGDLKNEGAITTPNGGQVYLVAPNVENTGIITAPNGDVLLAAGHTVHLVDSTNPALQVVLSAPEHEALNVGQIIAQGGTVGVYGALVRQRGLVSADSAVVGDNGKVVFKASRDTTLEAGSVTSATGAGKGGEIQVLGNRVGLVGDALVDASGQLGGGTVLVGGDYQGKNAQVQNAAFAYVGKDTQIKADAISKGDGGKIIVWADEATQAFGHISARGGVQEGDGGFVEVSGKHRLEYGARADLRAGQGKTGTLLLDPNDILIVGSDCSPAPCPLLDLPLSISQLTESSIEAQSLTANITLEANHSISTTGTFVDGGVDLENDRSLTMRTRNESADYGYYAPGINLSGTEFRVKGSGSITLEAGTDGSTSYPVSLVTGGLSTEGGNITLFSSDTATLSSFITAGTGGIMVSAGSGINVGTGGHIDGAHVKLTALEAGGMINTASGSMVTGNGIHLVADRMSLNGAANAPLVWLAPNSAGWKVDVGSTTDTVSGTLELSAAELNNVNAAILRIGSTASGDLTITDSLYSGPGGALENVHQAVSFNSGGHISQGAGKVISGGSSVQATGASVALTEENGTGVIAGGATSGDFLYRSHNAIMVSQIDGVSGIRLGGADRTVALGTGIYDPDHYTSIAQQEGAAIDTNGGRLALKGPGGVHLVDAGNRIGTIAAELTSAVAGKFELYAGGNLAVGEAMGMSGITTGGQHVELRTGEGFALSVDRPINAGSGEVSLDADVLALNNTVTASMVGIAPETAGRAITVGSTTCQTGAGTCLSVTRLDRLHAPLVAIGDEEDTPSGPIHVAGITDPGTNVLSDRNAMTMRMGLLSGYGMTQSGPIRVHDLVVDARSGNVVFDNPNNAVVNLAARLGGGNLSFTNSGTLAAGHIYGNTSSDDGGYDYKGIVTSGGNIALTTIAGDIVPLFGIRAGAGDVKLDAAGAISLGAVEIPAGTTPVTDNPDAGPNSGSPSDVDLGSVVVPDMVIQANRLEAKAGSEITMFTDANEISTINTGTAAEQSTVIFNAGAVVLQDMKQGGTDGLISVVAYSENGGDADVRVKGNVDAGSGGAMLLSADGAIVADGGTVSGGLLFAHATRGVALTSKVAALAVSNEDEATNSNISITNTGPVDVYYLEQVLGSGSIELNNYGAVTVSGDATYATVRTQSGSINLTANSPLTINGMVQSDSGAINLVASPSASGNDDLTINGTVETSGAIKLAAGGTVAINGAINGSYTVQQGVGTGTTSVVDTAINTVTSTINTSTTNVAPSTQTTTTSTALNTGSTSTGNTSTSSTSSTSTTSTADTATSESSSTSDSETEQEGASEEKTTVAENETGASENEPATKMYCN